MTKEKQTIIIEDEIRSGEAKHSTEERIASRPILSDSKGTIKLIKADNGKYMILIHPIKGNNIIVPCENLEEVANSIEKIMLNLEKARFDDKSISAPTGQRVKVQDPKSSWQQEDKGIMAEKTALYEKLYELYGREFDEWDMYESSDGLESDDITKTRIFNAIKSRVASNQFVGLLDEKKELPEEETAKAEELISQIVDIIMEEDCNYIFADLDQIEIDGEPLEKTRSIAQDLIDRAKVNDSGETAIDFNALGYNNAVQDYLLKALYSQKINLSDEQKEGIAEYKQSGFRVMNALMRGRGSFENLEKEYTVKKSIESIVGQLLKMEAIAKALPKREYDIILSRQGRGVGKSVEVGAENEYTSYVSFGTNHGTHIGDQQNTILYQRVLKADEPAIPIDVACEEALVGYSTECEVLTLPMQYEVTDSIIDSKGVQNVTMGNIENISVVAVLETRLTELREYLEEKRENSPETQKIDKMLEETISAIELVQQAKSNPIVENVETEPLRYFDDEKEKNLDTQDEILEQTVQASKKRTGLNKINQIINAIRSKVMQRRNVQQKNEGIENGDK